MGYRGMGARHGGVLRAVVALYPEATAVKITKAAGKPSPTSTRIALRELEAADLIERMVPEAFGESPRQAVHWRITRTGVQILATQKAEAERARDMWDRMAKDIDLYILAADKQYRRPEQERHAT